MTDYELIKVDNLEVHFERSTNITDNLLSRRSDVIHAVDDVSLTVERGGSMGVIGESGCGKSTLLETLMGLNAPTSGQILYKGQSTEEFGRSDWKKYRQNVQIIFQDPYNSLNPSMTVEEIVREPLEIHDVDDKDERVREALENTELNPPVDYLHRLPQQLSGGQKQRVSIARAIVSKPEVVLADEPVSMLDVSTQASILKLLSRLTDKLDLSLVYISHDISTVATLCDSINVMYLGKFVESAPTERLISDPQHPYTQALIAAVPRLNPTIKRERTDLEGAPSDPINVGTGCRFRDRCSERMEMCEYAPKFIDLQDEHKVACHLYYDHLENCNEDGERATDTKKGDQVQMSGLNAMKRWLK